MTDRTETLRARKALDAYADNLLAARNNTDFETERELAVRIEQLRGSDEKAAEREESHGK